MFGFFRQASFQGSVSGRNDLRIKENLHEIIAMLNGFVITFPLSSEKNRVYVLF